MDVRGPAVTEQVFTAFVDRWYGSTVRIARLLARDEAMARRIAREAWHSVIADHQLSNVALLRATVQSAVVHMAASPEPIVDPDRFEAAGHRWAGWWTDAGTPQEREAAVADREVQRALSGLDPALATIVALRDVEGLSPDEVQRVLDLLPAEQHELLAYGRARVWEALG